MGRLIHSTVTSLDGYAEAADGGGLRRARLGRGLRGLVDADHLFVTSTAVGGDKRFLPDGVRLDLELVGQRAFGSGLTQAHHRAR